MFSAMATVHDFHLIGYSVDVDARTIVLHTEWRYAGHPLRKVDAVFEGVEAYAFRDDPLPRGDGPVVGRFSREGRPH